MTKEDQKLVHNDGNVENGVGCIIACAIFVLVLSTASAPIGIPAAALVAFVAAFVVFGLFESKASAKRDAAAKLQEERRKLAEEEDRRKKQEKDRSERKISAEKAARRAAEVEQQAADYFLALESDELEASEIYARLSTEAHSEEIRLIARVEAQGFGVTFLDRAYSRFIRGDEYEQEANQDAFDIEFELLLRKLKRREKYLDKHPRQGWLRTHLERRFRKFVEVRCVFQRSRSLIPI